MAGHRLLDVVHHDLFGLVGVVVVHNQHDTLLKEGVSLLVALFLQGQQAAFPGDLSQLHQLVDDGHGVIPLGVHDNREVLGHGGQGADGEAGDQNGKGTADNDENAGRVEEVHNLARAEQLLTAAEHHTDDHDHEGNYSTNDICDIHRSAPLPHWGRILFLSGRI